MKDKTYYTKEEFMKEVNINNRSRLNQIIRGYTSKGYNYPAKLVEGVDFIRTEYIFFPSAINKMNKK